MKEDLELKYRQAFENLNKNIQNRSDQGKLIAMGYTSNLDLLCDFRTERLSELLAKHMPDAVLTELRSAEVIRTMEDLLSTLVCFCGGGFGGEVDVENIPLVKECFPFTYGMGGTAVQAAMALAQVEAPTLVHLTDDSKEVCDILDLPSIHVISPEGELIRTDRVTQTHETELHFILQFKKGDRIVLGDQELVIPCSNRVILTKITVNGYVPFYPPYFRWIEENAGRVTSNLASSFNCLFDEDVLMERLTFVKEHFGRYKQANPRGVTFFEDAHFHSLALRKRCLEEVYPCSDIASMNEEELQYTLENVCHRQVDMDDILSAVEGAKHLRDTFGVRKGVIVHTKDYSLYTGEPLDADIETGLMYGNLFATAKAKNGWYGTRDQLREVLDLPMSERGLACREMLKNSVHGRDTILVPTRYIDKPKYTIGLGDSFVGGVQLCF